MTSIELNRWFAGLLQPELFESADPSQNGIQVDNNGADISRVAFAVDACQETIDRAIQAGAGMLFVHHGLFWGSAEPVTGIMYRRVRTLLGANVALYASHLPLMRIRRSAIIGVSRTGSGFQDSSPSASGTE